MRREGPEIALLWSSSSSSSSSSSCCIVPAYTR
jgi:hypothetical protein